MTPAAPVRLLEVTSYPPPRAGWGIRVEFLKKRLEAEGHTCVVLNISTSRNIPSAEYETVLGGGDFLRKVWRFARQGFAELTVTVTEAVGDSQASPRAQLMTLGRIYLDFALTNRGMFELMFRHDLLESNQLGLREMSLPLRLASCLYWRSAGNRLGKS